MNKDPVYAINDYVWKLLKQKLQWKEIDGMVPMIPSRETPEFDGQSEPYIVYRASRETGRENDPFTKLAKLEYVIYAPNGNITAATKALDLLDDALGRFDDSAADINRNAHHPLNAGRSRFLDTRVDWTRVLDSQTVDPGESEGGAAAAYLSIRYQFTVEVGKYPILY